MRLKVSNRKDMLGFNRPDEILEVKKVPEPISKTGYVYRIGFPHFIGSETIQGLIKKVKQDFGGKVRRI